MLDEKKRCYINVFGIKCVKSMRNNGLDCKFCGQRFCIQHILAEVHGCEKRAKHDARKKFIERLNRTNKSKNQIEFEKEANKQKIKDVLKSMKEKRMSKQAKKYK